MFDMPWDPQLSERMISAWTNFGIYGIPNITNGDEVDWEYFSHKQSVMVFEDVVRMEKDFATNYRSSVCEYWYNTIGIETMSDICNERRQL